MKFYFYRAFNWTPPVYGHLPLILNPDGTKLSKRQNDIDIAYFRKEGIFPLAVLNFVIHAGGGFDNKGGAYYIDSYEELIKQVWFYIKVFKYLKLNVKKV